MRILLDTCAFLWIIADPDRLSTPAREAFLDAANEALLSVVSCWEIGVKHGLGRLPLPASPATFVPAMRQAHRIGSLTLEEPAAMRIAQLEDHHRDPFDRMLICQARHHNLVILTPDRTIRRYDVATLW